ANPMDEQVSQADPTEQCRRQCPRPQMQPRRLQFLQSFNRQPGIVVRRQRQLAQNLLAVDRQLDDITPLPREQARTPAVARSPDPERSLQPAIAGFGQLRYGVARTVDAILLPVAAYGRVINLPEARQMGQQM